MTADKFTHLKNQRKTHFVDGEFVLVSVSVSQPENKYDIHTHLNHTQSDTGLYDTKQVRKPIKNTNLAH